MSSVSNEYETSINPVCWRMMWVKHIFEVNEDKLGLQNSPTDELLISAPVRSHSGQFSHCPTSPLLATGQLKVMAMQLLCPSPGQFPRWFVKWLELVTRTSQVESWVKGGYLGRLAYQDNSTFQSFIRPFVDFSRNAHMYTALLERATLSICGIAESFGREEEGEHWAANYRLFIPICYAAAAFSSKHGLFLFCKAGMKHKTTTLWRKREEKHIFSAQLDKVENKGIAHL